MSREFYLVYSAYQRKVSQEWCQLFLHQTSFSSFPLAPGIDPGPNSKIKRQQAALTLKLSVVCISAQGNFVLWACEDWQNEQYAHDFWEGWAEGSQIRICSIKMLHLNLPKSFLAEVYVPNWPPRSIAKKLGLNRARLYMAQTLGFPVSCTQNMGYVLASTCQIGQAMYQN